MSHGIGSGLPEVPAWSIGDVATASLTSRLARMRYMVRIEHKSPFVQQLRPYGGRSFVDKLSAAGPPQRLPFRAGSRRVGMRPEAEDPAPAVQVSPDTRWRQIQSLTDGLRGIVRIAKLRPSALVSVLFAAARELRDFFFGDPAWSSLRFSFRFSDLPQLMIQRIDRLCLSSPARGQCLQGLQIRPVKSFSS